MYFHLIPAAGFFMAQASSSDDMTGWSWAMMITFFTLFAGLLATAIWALVTYVNRTRHDRRDTSPEGLLAERFARGEITADEYRQHLDVLRG